MRYLLLSVLCLLLAACDDNTYPPPAPPNKGKYAPEINPNPHYFMIVKGHIDPQLKNILQLKFVTTYYTTNPACEYSINTVEGVSGYRFIRKIIAVKTDNKGNYNYLIPLDLYKPKFCGWDIGTVAYKLYDSIPDYNAYIFAFFTKTGNFNNNTSGGDNWLCSTDKICKNTTSIPINVNQDLLENKNYSFYVNFKGQE